MKEHVLLIEHLQKQAAFDASNASTRLLAALSTGEEGVATALELKQCIEQHLQPELKSLIEKCKHLESELMVSKSYYYFIQSAIPSIITYFIKYISSEIPSVNYLIRLTIDIL